ncbi:MAG: trimeric intracellular cation channel family protein [Rhodospirillales bacterium]|nr:trimeric intracellular cation channel family protein [Rhodospirillales bacterium]
MELDDVQRLLDLCGVAVFAASGALKAAEKEMDVFGFAMLGCVTGIGGGTLRDLLLGIRPVFWIGNVEYPLLCAGVAVLVFVAGSRLRSRQRWLEWADAVGLATFCVIGTDIALRAGAPAVSAVLMGIVTAAFGGLLRDLLAGEVPLILRREIYATAAAAGSLTYIAVHAASGQTALALVLGFAVALAARSAALVYGLSLPSYRKRT